MSGYGTSGLDYKEFVLTARGVARALSDMGKAVEESGLDKRLTELIKIRASQINGCAYCLQYHLNLARRLGIPAARLDLVATWKETEIYSERERAALAWTEALTRMADGGADMATALAGLAKQFTVSEIAFLTSAIANINAWNRIAGGLAFTPPIPAENLKTAAL